MSLGLGLGGYLSLWLGLGACADPRQGSSSEVAAAIVSDAEREAARALPAQIAAMAAPPARADMLLRAADVSALMALIVPPEVPFTAPSGPTAPGELTDCLLTTGSAATLSECELGDHVIDGTWSLQYPAAHTELVDVFVGPGHHGSLWIDARLTVVERVMDSLPDLPAVRAIDGDIEISLMWDADRRDYALDASIHIDGLALDPASEGAEPRLPCALGGTITIRGKLSTGDESRVTVWLGPGCRDIHVARSAVP